jgi:hypothetical protein
MEAPIGVLQLARGRLRAQPIYVRAGAEDPPWHQERGLRSPRRSAKIMFLTRTTSGSRGSRASTSGAGRFARVRLISMRTRFTTHHPRARCLEGRAARAGVSPCLVYAPDLPVDHPARRRPRGQCDERHTRSSSRPPSRSGAPPGGRLAMNTTSVSSAVAGSPLYRRWTLTSMKPTTSSIVSISCAK